MQKVMVHAWRMHGWSATSVTHASVTHASVPMPVFQDPFLWQFVCSKYTQVSFFTCILRGIQFSTRFIEFVFAETNQIFGSNSNVI